MSDPINTDEIFADLLAGLGQMPASLTIPLEPAISFGGTDYTQIMLREPTSDEVRQAEEQLRFGRTPHAMRNYEMHLVAKAAGVPLPVVQKMPVSRVQAAMMYISIFLGAGRATGGN